MSENQPQTSASIRETTGYARRWVNGKIQRPLLDACPRVIEAAHDAFERQLEVVDDCQPGSLDTGSRTPSASADDHFDVHDGRRYLTADDQCAARE